MAGLVRIHFSLDVKGNCVSGIMRGGKGAGENPTLVLLIGHLITPPKKGTGILGNY